MDRKTLPEGFGFLRLMIFGSVVLLALQQLCYDTRLPMLTIHMGYYVLTAGMIFCTGFIFHGYVRGQSTKQDIICLAGKLYLLFVVAGACRYWLTDDRTRVESLVKILILRQIPKYSELYVSLLVFIGFVWLLRKPLSWLLRRWIAAAFLGILCIGVTMLPHDQIGYKIMGSLLGTEEFYSLAVLAFLGYFFLGFWLAGENGGKIRLWAGGAGLGMLITVGLTWVYRYKLVKGMHFPFRWWEVLIPVGFVLILGLIYRRLSENGMTDWLELPYFTGRAAVSIFALTYIKEYAFTAKMSTYEAVIIAIVVWVLASLAVFGLLRLYALLTGGKGFVRSALIYTAGFAVLMPAAYTAFIEEDYRMVWQIDGLAQYLPKAIWFSGHVRELVSSLLHGNFSYALYDFSFGLGDTIVPRLDPFYWMYAIFSPDNMESGFQWVTIIRMFLMGLAALALFLYLRKETWSSILASYIYVFGGFSFYAVPRHPQFASAMVLFPLLIIACEEIFRKKRWYLGTILIGLSLLQSYYFLYITTIGLVIYFVVRFLCMEKPQRTLKQFFSYLLTFAVAWLLGAGLGSMTIFTSVMNYAGSARSGSGAISTPSLWYYGPEWPTEVFTYFITASRWAGSWFKTGFIPLAYLMIVLLFLHQGKKLEKSLFVLCIALSMLPAAGYLLNGFKNVSNRWTYMLALLVSLIVAEMLPRVRELTNKQLALLSLSILPYILIVIGYEEYDMKVVIKTVLLLAVSLLLVIFSTQLMDLLNKKQMIAAFCVLMLASVWLAGYTLYGSGRHAVNEYTPAGTAYETMGNTNIRAFAGTGKIRDDFYRVSEVSTSRHSLNAAMLYDVHGISYNNSTMNGHILDYNRSLGNVMFSLVATYGMNNRSAMSALASVRYYGVSAGHGSQVRELPYGYHYIDSVWDAGEQIDIYENSCALPLGYTYDRLISEAELMKYNEVERQEVMLTHAVIPDPSVLGQAYKDIAPTLTAEKIGQVDLSFKDAQLEDGLLKAETDGTVIAQFEGRENSETYMVIRGTILGTDEEDNMVPVYVGGEGAKYRINAYPLGSTYSPGIDAYVFNMGYSETPISRCSVRFSVETQMQIDDIEIWCQPMDDYPQQIEALKKESLENLEISDNMVKGSISVSEPKILALSIPYSRNWHVYVDGQEAALLNVNIMYSGVELAAGDHEITVRYESKAIRNGLIVTGASLLIFIGCMIIGRRRSVKKSEQE